MITFRRRSLKGYRSTKSLLDELKKKGTTTSDVKTTTPADKKSAPVTSTPLRQSVFKQTQKFTGTVPTTSPVVVSAPPTKTAKKVGTPVSVTTKISAEERHSMIQKEAYFLAEKDGFKDDPVKYWLKAEAVIDARIKGGW